MYSFLTILILTSIIVANGDTYSYTGSSGTFTVPSTVSSIVVDAGGAQGGCSVSGNGGKGARVQATIALTIPITCQYTIGGQGGNTGSAGYNGGGTGNAVLFLENLFHAYY